MDIEEQVCNKELAMRIDKLGVKQESLWYWVGSQVLYKDNKLRLANAVDMPLQEYSAYTVAELGELLPNTIIFKGKIYFLITWKCENRFGVRYKTNKKPDCLPAQIAVTEANARAKMLIYLIENKLIKI